MEAQKTHELKTDPAVFDAVVRGAKTHEIRFNDRAFAVGDLLHLRETAATGEAMRAGAPIEYTGRQALREVSHIQTGYGLADGWVILSFANTDFNRRLRSLATHIWRAHYAGTAPQFELLDDADGVLSQIDNMVTGLMLKPTAQQRPTLTKFDQLDDINRAMSGR